MHDFKERKINGRESLNQELIELENDEGFAGEDGGGQVEVVREAEVLNPALQHGVDPDSHIDGVAKRRATPEVE